MRFLALKKLVFFIPLVFLLGNKSYSQDNPIVKDSTIINNSIVKKEGVINIEQDSRIERLLRIKRQISDDKKYRIQIYNGNLKGAEKIQAMCGNQFYGLNCDVSFETPNFKVRVGKFRTRLEADKYLMKVKEKYPSAFILAP